MKCWFTNVSLTAQGCIEFTWCITYPHRYGPYILGSMSGHVWSLGSTEGHIWGFGGGPSCFEEWYAWTLKTHIFPNPFESVILRCGWRVGWGWSLWGLLDLVFWPEDWGNCEQFLRFQASAAFCHACEDVLYAHKSVVSLCTSSEFFLRGVWWSNVRWQIQSRLILWGQTPRYVCE